ncbi:extracellular solute-binding protein [Patescibacteria group bacterium]|nr:extracellular solute-binding protein [Patescibacteria group bacterium]
MGAQFTEKLRQASIFFLVGVFGLTATGCGTTNTNKQSAPAQVRIWRLNQDVDTIRDSVNTFNSQTGGSAVVTYTKKTLPGYELDALKSMAARKGPDIWSIPNDWVDDYQNQIIPLPDNFFYASGATSGPSPAQEVKTLFPAGIANALIRPDGKVYGMPTNVDSLRLYYNPDLFDTALQDFRQSQGDNLSDSVYQPVRQLLSNPPATWNDLVNQAKYLTVRSGNTITRSAIALGTADNIPDAVDTLYLLMLQNGAQIISSDRRDALFHVPQTTPSGGIVKPGENALDFYTSFANPNKSNYSWNPSMPQALDAFAQGKVAMVIAYSDFADQLQVKYPKFHPQVAPVPQITVDNVQQPVNFIKFSIETVTQTADNPAAAFAFMKLYTAQDSADNLASEQKLRSPYLTTLNKDTSNYENEQALTGQTTFKEDHSQFDSVFHDMIVNVSQDNIAVPDAISTGAQQINQLLLNAQQSNSQ